MSGHRITADLLKADFDQGDPGDAGSITPTGNWTVVELVTAGAETRTLKDPVKSGQILILSLKTAGGNCVITADTTYNIANETILTFATAEESILLFSIPNGTSGYKWCAGSSTTGLGDAPAFS